MASAAPSKMKASPMPCRESEAIAWYWLRSCAAPSLWRVVLWARRHTRASWQYGNPSHPRTPGPGSLTGGLVRARRPELFHLVPGRRASFFSRPAQGGSGATDAGRTHLYAMFGLEQPAVLFSRLIGMGF